MRRSHATKYDLEKLKEDIKTKTQKEIAKELGCTQVVVHRICKNHGIKCPPRPDKNRVDLTNKKIGKLKVIKYEYTYRKTTYWLCRCDCGKEKIINGTHLRHEKTKSCGCIIKGQPAPNRIGYKGLPNNYIKDLQKAAFVRGLQWELTEKFLWELYEKQEGKCALTGIDIGFPINQKKIQRKTNS